MKIVIDNKIVRILAHQPSKMAKDPYLSNPKNRISFRWPSLLEYLGLGSIFSSLPEFVSGNPIFEVCLSTLYECEKKEELVYIYDRLFTENLNQIKNLPQINATSLLLAIIEQRENPSFSEVESMLSPTLRAYENALIETTSQTMHDLILYLSWDRMCVWMTHLFDHQTTNPIYIKGIWILKECLIESYQHIQQQGRTSLGFYRLLESLFFYQMREENIQQPTADEWTMLNQSFQVLKGENELADFIYLDDAVVLPEKQKTDEDSSEYLTLDSPVLVNSRLALAQYMMTKLKAEDSSWGYVLQPQKIIFVADSG